ncbi:class I SAM-dependent methyltransferase [Myceligenerans pegani]|uniref:Class I SAM-dependent methyltransferase n=1 Tax=Myceligenerans pegani TaxID=2776917 RepID=A0ABR9N129_9MICO|nr:class I SAM-dependent methyltransferase [Myceligenerans sp. TRM 65318]MBE1876936.1 class I SAM-dependent methyltransferase [Myceligenerans sp. TRM 65318]MBE3019207.1 class I SAM-dependent methyltransferase [Myceligenerans sp. TRM 65318]
MWDVRENQGRVVRRVADGLHRFNARHPWSHNDHFHGWILRRLPRRGGTGPLRVLDVGCGRGALIGRLRERGAVVVGIDADAGMARTAATRFAGDTGVRIEHTGFEEISGTYDAVTMVASLHHMPLDAALTHASDLLAPGGRLLVVGLARVGSPREAAVDLVSAVVNPVVGLVKHPRPAPRRDKPSRAALATTAVVHDDAGPEIPMRDPGETHAEIAATAARVLPGARFRQRLFFRYTLEWAKPAR